MIKLAFFADIDMWRKAHMAGAELVDAWRLIPRGVVILFGYGTYKVVEWYMHLKPYILEGCIDAGGKVTECVIQAPTNQHVMLLTGLFGLAVAVFGFYTTSGRKWNGFTHWNKKKENDEAVAEEQAVQRN